MQLVDLPSDYHSGNKYNSWYRAFQLGTIYSSTVRNPLPGHCYRFLIYVDLTVSGHGHQLPCRHHTETDELDEGKSFVVHPTMLIVHNAN